MCYTRWKLRGRQADEDSIGGRVFKCKRLCAGGHAAIRVAVAGHSLLSASVCNHKLHCAQVFRDSLSVFMAPLIACIGIISLYRGSLRVLVSRQLDSRKVQLEYVDMKDLKV